MLTEKSLLDFIKNEGRTHIRSIYNFFGKENKKNIYELLDKLKKHGKVSYDDLRKGIKYETSEKKIKNTNYQQLLKKIGSKKPLSLRISEEPSNNYIKISDISFNYLKNSYGKEVSGYLYGYSFKNPLINIIEECEQVESGGRIMSSHLKTANMLKNFEIVGLWQAQEEYELKNDLKDLFEEKIEKIECLNTKENMIKIYQNMKTIIVSGNIGLRGYILEENKLKHADIEIIERDDYLIRGVLKTKEY